MVIEWEDLDEESVKARRAANTSVTDESDLTALMTLADLAGRDFTAERQNARVIFPGATCVSENKVSPSDELKLKSLPIPIRPPWTKEMSAQLVDANEKEAFLQWRRELARMEESYDLILTPFEKNLEFWRQLWRVVEKSDVVVQVVDARNPLLYRCESLENYVQQAGAWKGNVLLFNKADLLPRQAIAAAFALCYLLMAAGLIFLHSDCRISTTLQCVLHLASLLKSACAVCCFCLRFSLRSSAALLPLLAPPPLRRPPPPRPPHAPAQTAPQRPPAPTRRPAAGAGRRQVRESWGRHLDGLGLRYFFFAARSEIESRLREQARGPFDPPPPSSPPPFPPSLHTHSRASVPRLRFRGVRVRVVVFFGGAAGVGRGRGGGGGAVKGPGAVTLNHSLAP